MPPTTTIKSENQSQDTINATTTIHDSDDDQEDEQMTMLEGSQLIGGGGGSSMSNHNPLSAFGKGNVNHLSSIASLNQIENDIAGLLDIGIKMFEDISMGTQQQQQLHGSSDATAAAAAVSSDLNKQFVTTVKKVAQELAAHIHRQSQQPTLPFESNSYSSFERLNNMVERSRMINDQL